MPPASPSPNDSRETAVTRDVLSIQGNREPGVPIAFGRRNGSLEACTRFFVGNGIAAQSNQTNRSESVRIQKGTPIARVKNWRCARGFFLWTVGSGNLPANWAYQLRRISRQAVNAISATQPAIST